MYNFVVVRFTNRVDGTSGDSVKPYEIEGDAMKEFFRHDRSTRLLMKCLRE